MTERRKRKAWSDDEKRLICGQTRRPGISVSQVARRYDVNANLVFKWLRDPRFAVEYAAEDEARFLPVEIVGEDAGKPSAVRHGENHIEIELAGGHNLKISGAYDPDALARLIRGLST